MHHFYDTVINQAGSPVKGATVTVKNADTSLATIYADAGGTPLTNPVVADSLGFYDFYTAATPVTLEIRSGGTLLRTISSVDIPGGGGGSGTVTTVAVTPANGVSAAVSNATTTPTITLGLGAITPTSVTAAGAVAGATVAATGAVTAASVAASGAVTAASVTASGAVSASNLAGTNTGDQTSANLNHTPAGTGAVVRTAASRFGDSVSVLDFIPVTYHAGIKARTDSTDLATYFTAAITYLNSIGGGNMLIPPGTYNVGSCISMCRNLRITGHGPESSIIQGTHAGTAGALSVTVPTGSLFKNIEAINSSSRSFITIENLTLKLTNAGSLGACFYDQGSSYLNFTNVNFINGKYGQVLDQSEVCRFINCRTEGQLSGGAGSWLLNGSEINPSSLGLFTNQIAYIGCHWNEASGTYGVVHDGGYDFTLVTPNFNGGGLRLAGVQPFLMVGGEYESVIGNPVMQLVSTRWNGGVSGGCYGALYGGVWAAVAGQYAINITSQGSLAIGGSTIFAVQNSGGVDCAINGMQNVGVLSDDGSAYSTYVASGVPVYKAYATQHYAPTQAVRTEAGTAVTASLAHSNSLVRFTNGAATTFTVPPNSSVAFQIGTKMSLIQAGAGKLTVAAGAGVTVNAEGGLLSAKAQYTRIVLEKVLTDTWNLTGDRIA